MSKRANTTVIGAFVIGAIALILGAVMLFSTGRFFDARVIVVSVFEGSVTGLQVGAPVEFRGVPVGTVTNIKALYDRDKASFVIPVYMSLDGDSVTTIRSGDSELSAAQEMKNMIEQGLRARLDIRSLVTGQRFVDLAFHPNTPARIVGIDKDILEIPSLASRLERVTSMFDKLDVDQLAAKAVETLDGISALVNSPVLASTLDNLDNASRNANTLMLRLQTATESAEAALASMLSEVSTLGNDTDERLARVETNLNATLASVRALARNLDKKIEPLSNSAEATMDQATETLRAAESLIGEDSPTRYNLDKTLDELAAAARSVRLMADYLEQNPDALLKGKGN